MALIGKTADMLDVDPQSAILVGAMYYATSNEIIAFPGLLEHYDIRHPLSSEALYGSLGFILGHEMVHAFDKRGICYGPDGTALDWMEPSTKEVFNEKLKCVEKLYSSRYLPGSQFTQFVDGKRTLSENVADIDGLKVASKAYDVRRQREGLPPANKTEFFKGFAQSFCENMSPEDVKLLYAHDEHAPSKVRVNEALRNNEEFAATFACMEDAMMSSPDKCYVWSKNPREDARQENAVSRTAASGMCVSFMTASFLVLLYN